MTLLEKIFAESTPHNRLVGRVVTAVSSIMLVLLANGIFDFSPILRDIVLVLVGGGAREIYSRAVRVGNGKR